MGAGVVGLEVVRVVGAGERERRWRGRSGSCPAVTLLLLLEPMGLDLHEVVVLAEHFLVPARRLEGLRLLALRTVDG